MSKRMRLKKLLESLRPAINVISRKSLTKKIDLKAQSFKKNLISVLSEIKYVSTTCDCWKGFRRHYLAMTVHWIDPNTFLRKMAPLACKGVKGSVTYNVLATMISEIHKKFAIQNKVLRTTTDNASDFVKAFRIFATPQEDEENENEDDDDLQPVDLSSLFNETETVLLPPHHRYCAHVFNLISTKDAEKAETDAKYKKIWRSTLGKSQGIWHKQNQSTVNANFIKDTIGRYLTIPNATRWNSFYDSLQCIHEIAKKDVEKLHDIFDHCGLLSRLTESELTFVSEYITVMKPIACALDTLQAEKNAYAGYLLPEIYTVRRRLQNLLDKMEFCGPLVKALTEGINRRFSAVMEDEDFVLTAVLHPQFQLFWLKTQEKENKALALLKSKIAADSITENYEETSKNEGSDFFDFLSTKKNTTEVEQFVTMGGEGLQCLDRLPAIKKLFLKYNTVVPSSAAVERLFSCGGLVLSKKRAQLSDALLESCILLKGSEF